MTPPGQARAARPVLVWDRVVRVLHWTLVAAVVTAGLSSWLSDGLNDGLSAWLGGRQLGWLHQPAGYVALTAVLLRLLWGWVGSGHARFAQFVRPPPATLAYLRLVLRGREPRHIGHNPLGGWMVMALLVCIGGLGLTGWLYTTDRFWGDALVDTLHQALAWTLLALVATHIAGVAFTSWRQRENLVAAMFSGRKRPPGQNDLD